MADILQRVDPKLLAAYDAYMLTVGTLTIEQFRVSQFSKLPPIDDAELQYSYARYKSYRSTHPCQQMRFSTYVEKVIGPRPQKSESVDEENVAETRPNTPEPVVDREEEEEQQLPSSSTVNGKPVTVVNSRLLKQWREDTLTRGEKWSDGWTGRDISKLKESAKDLCVAGNDIVAKRAQPFRESDFVTSSCDACHRHQRLRNTHALETVYTAHMSQDGGPHHLVAVRNPASGAAVREVICNGDYRPNDMQLYHTYVSSRGLLNWLRGKLVRHTGVGLPSGIQDYFEKKENFNAAVDLAEQVFKDADENPETNRAEIIHNIEQLTPKNKTLLHALTQYLCNQTKRGDISRLPSGSSSLQTMHAMVTQAIRKDDTRPSAIIQKVIVMGYGCLTPAERRALLHCVGRKQRTNRFLSSSSNVERMRYNLKLPILQTWSEWREAEVREQLKKDVLLADAQRKAGISLAPASTLKSIDSESSVFLSDLRGVYGPEAETGVGVWLIPLDSDYEADLNKAMNLDYFSHFFVDMSPYSKLGKLNVASVHDRSWTLITDSSTRVATADLFPSKPLREDFHDTLSALAVDIKRDPQKDTTLAVHIETIPNTLFPQKLDTSQ